MHCNTLLTVPPNVPHYFMLSCLCPQRCFPNAAAWSTPVHSSRHQKIFPTPPLPSLLHAPLHSTILSHSIYHTEQFLFYLSVSSPWNHSAKSTVWQRLEAQQIVAKWMSMKQIYCGVSVHWGINLE